MTASASIKAYDDCFKLLEQAQEDEQGVRVEMRNGEEANFYRMRIHYARKLDRDKNRVVYEDPQHPMHGASAHDNLVCRIRTIEEKVYLYIEKNETVPGQVEALSEVPAVEYEEVKQIEHRPLLIEAIKRRI